MSAESTPPPSFLRTAHHRQRLQRSNSTLSLTPAPSQATLLPEHMRRRSIACPASDPLHLPAASAGAGATKLSQRQQLQQHLLAQYPNDSASIQTLITELAQLQARHNVYETQSPFYHRIVHDIRNYFKQHHQYTDAHLDRLNMREKLRWCAVICRIQLGGGHGIFDIDALDQKLANTAQLTGKTTMSLFDSLLATLAPELHHCTQQRYQDALITDILHVFTPELQRCAQNMLDSQHPITTRLNPSNPRKHLMTAMLIKLVYEYQIFCMHDLHALRQQRFPAPTEAIAPASQTDIERQLAQLIQELCEVGPSYLARATHALSQQNERRQTAVNHRLEELQRSGAALLHEDNALYRTLHAHALRHLFSISEKEPPPLSLGKKAKLAEYILACRIVLATQYATRSDDGLRSIMQAQPGASGKRTHKQPTSFEETLDQQLKKLKDPIKKCHKQSYADGIILSTDTELTHELDNGADFYIQQHLAHLSPQEKMQRKPRISQAIRLALAYQHGIWNARDLIPLARERYKDHPSLEAGTHAIPANLMSSFIINLCQNLPNYIERAKRADTVSPPKGMR